MPRAEALRICLATGAGAALGSLLRHLAGLTALALDQPVPLATLAVNVAGSFIIMLFATLTGPDGRLMVAPVRGHFVTSGFCGGLTTFSALSLETVLMAAGRPLAALAYLAGSLAASLAAAWLGLALAARLNRRC